VLCRREGAASAAAEGAAAPAVASASEDDSEERHLTLRLPPVVLAVPLLALAAFGVIRAAPWRPMAPASGVEIHAPSSAGGEALADGDTPSDTTLVEPVADTLGDSEQRAPIEPSTETLADTAADPEPSAPSPVEPGTTDKAQGPADAAERKEAAQRELARAREQVEVVVYYAQWCGYCTKARAYLAQRGIRSVEHDVDVDTRASGQHRRLNPRGSVPTIEIDGQVLVGFDARGIERALDRAARARLSRERGS